MSLTTNKNVKTYQKLMKFRGFI